MPLLWLSLAFLGGILAGWFLGGAFLPWLIGALGLLFLVLAILHFYYWRIAPRWGLMDRFADCWPPNQEVLLPGFILLLLPLAALLGLARWQSTLPVISPAHLAWYNDLPGRVRLEGVIAADPEFRDAYTQLEVRVERLRLPDSDAFQPVEGLLLARLPPGGDWRYGDRLQIEGRLRAPFETEEFSYRAYLAHHSIYTTLSCGYCSTCAEPLRSDCAWLVERAQGSPLRRAIYDLRRRAHGMVHVLFPDPEAALLSGILLGIETGIPEDLLDAFRLTGVAHIIAISGFNFAIISGLLVALFGRLLGPWRGMLAAWIGIAFYAVLAGASAGVVRAALMGGLAVFALRLGRRSGALNTLAFVAALMALFDPHVLWDVGFQLSFMATLGLMLYADPLSRGFIVLAGRWIPYERARRLAGPVGEYLLFTLAAQLTTLPLILYYFHQASYISLIANPLVLPAQPSLMILGGLATLAGLVFLPLGRLLSVLAWPWIAYTVRIVEALAQAPGAARTIAPLSPWVVLAFYLLLFSFTLLGGRLKAWLSKFGAPLAQALAAERSVRLGWIVSLAAALLALVVWQRVLSQPDGRLHLIVFEAGSGEALLIQTPGGRNLLINGGASANALAGALGRRLPLGKREIDWLVVAATREEQIAALPAALERFQVERTLWAGSPLGGYSARQLQKALAAGDIPLTPVLAGQTLDLGEGARLQALASGPRGAVLLFEWGRFRALLPLGLDADALQTLLRDPAQPRVTALLLADAGHAALNPPEWIARWNPQLALLSVAAGNPEGLPHPEALQALGEVPLLRTDQNGWIELTTNGEQLWVEVEHRREAD
ncbi:MAG: ComEC/Rec2 family competence protein [Anaerolineae bacterium]|nr:ComEC/Rec2 family competence protein [Anaerolineae bacterium]